MSLPWAFVMTCKGPTCKERWLGQNGIYRKRAVACSEDCETLTAREHESETSHDKARLEIQDPMLRFVVVFALRNVGREANII